ncbi:hypothetical protein AK812_SmicGene21053 [Symbiodinium microadriaticum]|uniref:Uncharacterized protein n=1 Tax=Symbiodinium microadriaticum TaxID=2951 RepID=A0A1Q9DND4_SYMMI|nr:hypothetical protein AK812_SmicGene21053 [Symbiodinium microadriaticum]
MTTRQDERGWTPLDCADEAGEVEVSNLLVAHAPDADLGQGGAMHPVLAAAVTAVENYGWQAVHEGRREWTALHWAASEGPQFFWHLQVDQAGRSALDYARNAGHRRVQERSGGISPIAVPAAESTTLPCKLRGGRSRKQSPDEDKEIGIHNELLASVSDLSDLELSVLGSVDLSEQPALLKELKLHGCRLFGVPRRHFVQRRIEPAGPVDRAKVSLLGDPEVLQYSIMPNKQRLDQLFSSRKQHQIFKTSRQAFVQARIESSLHDCLHDLSDIAVCRSRT